MDQTTAKKHQEKVQSVLGKCKESLRECIATEDYEEEGYISLGQLRECLETLDLLSPTQIDEETLDYIVYVLYQRSEGL